MLAFLLDRFAGARSPGSLQTAQTRLLKVSQASSPDDRRSPRQRPSPRSKRSGPVAADGTAPSPATAVAATWNRVGAILDAAIGDRDREKAGVARASVELVRRRLESEASRA